MDDIGLSDEEKLNLKKRVTELFIISKRENTNYTFRRDFNFLYVIYENVTNRPLKMKGKEGYKKKMVQDPYFKEKKLNFATHRALKFRITDFEGDIFGVL